MNDSTVVPEDRDRVRIAREVTVRGQLFRLCLEDTDDDRVIVDLRIGNDDDEPSGRLHGHVRTRDLASASRALTSLLSGAAATLKQPRPPSLAEYVKQARLKHPNAYAAWTAEDDARLVELYRAHATVAELSKKFGRKPSAIERRLEKLIPSEVLPDQIDNGPTDDEPPDVWDDFPSRDP